MATSSARSVFMGPRLRRLRRDLGLTQADMAADLEISAPYVALLERNQRPVPADMLLRLARTYKIGCSRSRRNRCSPTSTSPRPRSATSRSAIPA